MKLVLFTSNGIRHKYVTNTLSQNVDDTLVICECNQNDAIDEKEDAVLSPIDEHFRLRYLTEKKIFSGNDYFNDTVLPLIYKEANLRYTYQIVKEFEPDLMIVFGSSIIKEPLLSLKPNRFINLHLGLSPYYRGSGTNFWPFVNDELEYLGSTILHLDAGIDTGDIICHVRPNIELNDNVHTVGCKIIKSSVESLIKIIKLLDGGKKLNRVKQWEVKDRYYKTKDFDEIALSKYKNNLKNNMIKNYLESEDKKITLVDL